MVDSSGATAPFLSLVGRRRPVPRQQTVTLRIYVVDEDEMGRATMGRLLRYQGHQTIACSTARELLLALSKEAASTGTARPVLVMINSSTLGPTAMDVVQALSAHGASGRSGQIRVIILTKFGDNEDVISLLRAGASDYIRLPADPDEVRMIVERVKALPLVG